MKNSKKTPNRIVHICLKVLLTLLMVTPILGAIGIFPAPTREMYQSDAAFNFIHIMMNDASYIHYLMSIVFAISIVLLWIGREAAAAILIAPITANIVGFHLFLDGGLFTAGAIMGNVLLLLNIYLLWKNWDRYSMLLNRA